MGKIHIPGNGALLCGDTSMIAEFDTENLCKKCMKRVEALLQPEGVKVPGDGVIYLSAPLPHAEDAHLRVVLALLTEGNEGRKWVTWLHNTQNKGFHHGHYFQSEAEGRSDWAERVAAFMRSYLGA